MRTLLTSLTALLFSTSALAQDAEEEQIVGQNTRQSSPIIKDMPKFADQPEGVGVGFGVGEPMGLAAAFRPNPDHTIAAMMGWSLTKSTLHLHADYLITITEVHPAESSLSLSIYSGVGPTLNLGSRGDEAGLGARVPVGVSMAFDKPIDIFVEIVPVLGVIPDVKMYANGTVGVRAWFQTKRGSSLDRLRSHDALNKRH